MIDYYYNVCRGSMVPSGTNYLVPIRLEECSGEIECSPGRPEAPKSQRVQPTLDELREFYRHGEG